MAELKKIALQETHLGRYEYGSFHIDVYEVNGVYESWLKDPYLMYPFRLIIATGSVKKFSYKEFLSRTLQNAPAIVSQYLMHTDALKYPELDSGNAFFISVNPEDYPELIKHAQSRSAYLSLTLHFMMIYQKNEEYDESDYTHYVTTYLREGGADWRFVHQEYAEDVDDTTPAQRMLELSKERLTSVYLRDYDVIHNILRVERDAHGDANDEPDHDYVTLFNTWLDMNHLQKESLSKMDVTKLQITVKNNDGKIETFYRYELADGIKGFYTGIPITISVYTEDLMHNISFNYAAFYGLYQIFFGEDPEAMPTLEEYISDVFEQLDIVR